MKKLIILVSFLICAVFLVACEGKTGKDHDLPEDMYQFEAKILEVHEGFFLVEPSADSQESKSSSQITVSRQNADPDLEWKVGDTILITYDGQIMETYPAQLGQVYKIEKLTFILTDGNE